MTSPLPPDLRGPLPQRKPLGPDEVRQLLRECVTVVDPGQVLIVRIDPDDGFTPRQVREIAEVLHVSAEGAGIRAMLVIGHEIGTAKPAPGPGSGTISLNAERALHGLPPFDPDISLPATPSLVESFRAFAPSGTDTGALMASLRDARMPEIHLSKSAVAAVPAAFTQPGTTCAACHARGVATFHAPGGDECRDRQAELDRLEKEKPGKVTWCHACTRPHPRSLICPEQRDMAARVAEAAAKLPGNLPEPG